MARGGVGYDERSKTATLHSREQCQLVQYLPVVSRLFHLTTKKKLGDETRMTMRDTLFV